MVNRIVAFALLALLASPALALLEFDLISQKSVLKERREATRRSTDLVLEEPSTVPAFTAQVTIGNGAAATNFELALSSQDASIVVLGNAYSHIHPVTYYNGTVHKLQGASRVANAQTGSLYDFGVVNYDVYSDQVVFDTLTLTSLPIAVVSSVGTAQTVTVPFGSYDGILGLGLKSQELAATSAVAATIESTASAILVPPTPPGVENSATGGLTISALFCDTWGKLYFGSVTDASTDAQASTIIYGPMSTTGYDVVLRSASIGSTGGIPNIFLAAGNVVFDFTSGSVVIPPDAWTSFVSNVGTAATAVSGTSASSGNCWQNSAFTDDSAVNSALPTLQIVAGDILFNVAATNSYLDLTAATNTVCISAVQGLLAGQLVLGGVALESLFITFDRSTATFATGAVGLAVSAACTSPASASYTVQSYAAFVQASLDALSNSVSGLPADASVAQIQAAVGSTLQNLNAVSTLGNLDAAALAAVQLARFTLVNAVISAFEQGLRKRATPTASQFQNALNIMESVAFVPSQLNSTTIASITNFLINNAHLFGDLANGASVSDLNTLQASLPTYVTLVDIILLTHVTPTPNSAANFNPTAVGASESFDLDTTDAAALFSALELAAGGLLPFLSCPTSLTAPAVTVGVTITLYSSGASGFSVSSASTSGTATFEPSGSVSAPSVPDSGCFGVLYIQTLFDQFAGESASLNTPDSVGWILYTQFYGNTPLAPEAESSLSMSVSVPLVNGLNADYTTISCIQRNPSDASWSEACTKDSTKTTATQFVCTCPAVVAAGTYFSVGHAAVQPFYGNGAPISLVGLSNVVVDVSTRRDCVAYDATLGVLAGWAATINDGTINAKPACCTRRGMFDSGTNECNVPRCTAAVSSFPGFVSSLAPSDPDYHVTGTFCFVNCYAPGTSVPGGVSLTKYSTITSGGNPPVSATVSALKNAYVVSVYNTIEAAYTVTVSIRKRIGTSYACISKGTLSDPNTCSIPGCNTVRDVHSSSAFIVFDAAATSDCYTDCYA